MSTHALLGLLVLWEERIGVKTRSARIGSRNTVLQEEVAEPINIGVVLVLIEELEMLFWNRREIAI